MTRLGLGCLAALCLLVAIACGIGAASALLPMAPLYQDLGGQPRATIYGVGLVVLMLAAIRLGGVFSDRARREEREQREKARRDDERARGGITVSAEQERADRSLGEHRRSMLTAHIVGAALGVLGGCTAGYHEGVSAGLTAGVVVYAGVVALAWDVSTDMRLLRGADE